MVKKRVSITVLSLMISLPGAALAAGTPAPATPAPTNALAQLTADITAPNLSSFTLSPGSVNVGDTITITAKATDDLSGVKSVDAYLMNGSASKDIAMTYDSTTDTWSGTYKVTATDLNGTWYLQFGFYDNAGNYGWASTTGTVNVNNPNADSTAPVINSVNYTPQTIQPGTPFTISANVSDNVGVDTVYAYLYTPTGIFQDSVQLTYDSKTGQWSGSYTLSQYAEAGDWTIEIDATDTSGNLSIDDTHKFNLVNANADTTAPVIGDVTVSQSTVNPGDTLKVSANLSDTGTGLSDSYVTLWSPSGTSWSYLMAQDPSTGLWTADISIPSTFEPGAWTIDVSSYDIANNYSSKAAVQTITVQNAGDYTPPAVTDFQATTSNNDITFTATITDDKSTVSDAEVNLYSPSGQQAHSVALTYDQAANKWTGTYTIQQNDEPGVWSTSVTAGDSAGNSGTTPQNGVTFANANYDGAAPVLDSFDITPANANVGQDVTLSVAAHDDLSGVGQVQAYLVNPSGTAQRYVSFTYDTASNKWVGTYTVANNDEPGAWTISELDIIDKAGNYAYETPTNTFTVTNTNTDFTAPVFDSATLSATTAVAGDQVTVKVKAHDAQSSMQGVTADFVSPDGINSKQVPLTLDTKTNEWVGTLTVDPADAVGQWNLNVYLEDTAGNHDYVSANTNLTINAAPVISAKYDEAVFYFDNNNFYNAVYFAGEALKAGDQRPEVQTLMNNAAKALLDSTATLDSASAANAYQLLSTTTGVPADIKAAADAQLTSVPTSANYGLAQWYFDQKNYYNAVHFAGVAINTDHDTSAAAQTLLNNASQALIKEAGTLTDLTPAQNGYQLLLDTAGVPDAVKTEAQKKFDNIVIYATAQWYDGNNNAYNAVYYAGAALDAGANYKDVTDLQAKASQALFDAAAAETNVTKAQNNYQLLVDTTGVPSKIKTDAQTKLDNIGIFATAQWYNDQKNYYNAVHFAGKALDAGANYQEVTDLQNQVSQALFDAAATMSAGDAANAYQLLSTTTGVPAQIKTDSQAKLTN